MRTSLTLSIGSLALALAAALAPTRADACSPNFCRAWKSLAITHDAPVPGEGALVIAAEFGEDFDAPEPTDLGAVLVEVSSEMGDVITGEASLNLEPLLIVWRPDAPLPPGTYEVHVSADNSVFGDDGWCGEPMVDQVGSVEVSADPLPETVVPPITGAAEVVVNNTLSLESLVCCDGAAPVEVDCGFPGVQWSEGFCATTEGAARLRATFTVDPEALAAGAGQLIVEGFDLAGTRTITGTDVVCITPSVTNLATGKSAAGDEICVGERLVDQLGPVALDPTAVLAEQCVGEPYTCEVDVGSWNSRSCEPWPPGEDTTTGGETSGGGETTGAGTSTGGVTGGEDTTDGATGDTTDTSATGGGEATPEVACACRSDAPRPTGLLWLLAALPLLRRRRA